jgi:exosortase/archaeosortase family protein|nr:archaeosortase/exosortase family protein [Salinivirgaceae bacterium]
MQKFLKKINISNNLKKEIARYVISFFFAWLVSALISDFPYFKKLLIQSINLDTAFTKLMTGLSKNILNTFGFETFTEGNFIQIIGTPGVIFRYGCLGFRELAFFVVFVALQYGSLKHKAWYIPCGIVLLIVLNTIRALIIIIGQYRDPSQFQIIHDVVSPILMYPAILFLWLFWLNTYGKVQKTTPKTLK